MNCPYCNHEEHAVVDTRRRGDNLIKRRRECEKCHSRFNTLESVEVAYLSQGNSPGEIVKYKGKDYYMFSDEFSVRLKNAR